MWSGLGTFPLKLGGVLGFTFVAYILWESITKTVISIAPISVPQVLATNGYTSDVAAERLESALNNIVTVASPRGWAEVAMQADLPSIVVPSTALSTEALAAQLRRFFRIESRWNVSGEITVVDKKLWLHLRMNGRDLYATASGGDPEHPDDLFGAAAQMIFDKINPSILAASRGNALFAEGKTEQAIAEFRTAIELDPRSALPRNNLGLVLGEQGKTQEAIVEFRNAIMLDPGYAPAYENLGLALSDLGETDDAITLYRKAIQLDPYDASSHARLGNALRDQGKINGA
ncbi:MAG: tetratricopeptide repeat protein, partial [Candidatus Binatia bacterium]